MSACIREYERGLEELGVVPAEVRELIRKIEAEGGAAKISGAGSLESTPAGAGCILVFHPEPSTLDGWAFLRSLRRYDVGLGAPGLRLEAA